MHGVSMQSVVHSFVYGTYWCCLHVCNTHMKTLLFSQTFIVLSYNIHVSAICRGFLNDKFQQVDHARLWDEAKITEATQFRLNQL